MRITFVCPELLCNAANHLFMTLGGNADDGYTFASALWQSMAGDRFAAASLEVADTWLATMEPPFARPGWDAAKTVDLEAAEAAAARLHIVSETPRQPLVDRIAVIKGPPGWQVLSELGLQMNDPNEEI